MAAWRWCILGLFWRQRIILMMREGWKMRKSAGLPGQNGQPLQNAPEEGAEGSVWLGEAQVALSIQRYAETKVWGFGED